MASFGGSGTGSGDPGPWRNGHNEGSQQQVSGGEGQEHPSYSSRPSSSHSHHSQCQGQGQGQVQGRKAKDRRAHDTVVNMLSMLTLGLDDGEGSSSGGGADNNQRLLLLSMANTPESCLTLRQAGCIPLLVELIHPPRNAEIQPPPEIIQVRAARALKNIVQFNPNEKEKKKELRVLRLLEGIRLFSDAVKGLLKKRREIEGDESRDESREREDEKEENIQHPTTSLGALMKLSFDDEHKYTMCLLGAIHALADLIVSDHLIHGTDPAHMKEDCLILRRLTGMALTNLTVNDKTNKALLCGMKEFLTCLVNQLSSENEDVCQISASVLRNLSCRADSTSRANLSEVSPCVQLMIAAMRAQRENTLKANLGAIWNLSAQCPKNMADVASASPDALTFLLSIMRPSSPQVRSMKSPITIVEHASGILRNISPHLRTTPALKKVLRDNHCYEILLEHLTSSSMLVVGNACGTLSTISGGPESEDDQRRLLELDSISMLKRLVYSKDQRISQGSSTALRNLLSSKFAKEYSHTLHLDQRLSAQIYSNPGARIPHGTVQNPGLSPSSESDHDQDQNPSLDGVRTSRPFQAPMPEPPAAHQHSTPSSASLVFYPPRSCSAGAQKPMVPFRRTGRPASINYFPEAEPLDLTMTSAKSSPIHVISAAEFGIGHQRMGQRMQRPSTSAGVYPQQKQPQGYQLYPAGNPSMVQNFMGSGNVNAPATQGQYAPYSRTSAFNQSCPEILSRFQGHVQEVNSSKPLDFSSTSGSASSSARGGGEASAGSLLNDSNGGTEGDTTFNYSLQYADEDTEEDSNQPQKADEIKTYCYEGTPQNFSKANSCQDLVNELDYEQTTDKSRLQPIDEVKPYYVENTPAAFSRASSLSSIHSSDEPDGQQATAQDNAATSEHKIPETSIQTPPQPMPRKRNSHPHTPCRVTFSASAEETPLMFSRCSSVASLDSCADAGGNPRGDDDLSDYSRRASEVVSPSDLPDSPRALRPPVRFENMESRSSENQSHQEPDDTDGVKNFSMPEGKSGLNSCRSLSPLTIDGEELPILSSKDTLQPESGLPEIQESNSCAPNVNPGDEITVFAVEGTPFRGVSNATSLSDLMGDIEESPELPQPNAPAKDSKEIVATEKLSIVEENTEESSSDAQLLEKCIRVGKAMGIPKSQSEFGIKNPVQEKGEKVTGKKVASTSKSQDFEFDDPDLAALIQIGRNQSKDKDKSKGSKSRKSGEKKKAKEPTKEENSNTSILKEETKCDKSTVSSSEDSVKKSESSEEKEESKPKPSPNLQKNSSSEMSESSQPKEELNKNSKQGHALQPGMEVSTVSLGSEWNDETPTFSSPIPSMSISTALKMAESQGSVGIEKSAAMMKASKVFDINLTSITNMNVSCVSASALLENMEPPSTFSNLASSIGSPALSDRINRRFKVLKDAADNSTHSNLTGQRPPAELDMENSMISVASIKSEIYEISDNENDLFKSATEGVNNIKGSKENSIGANTYTIFPPENANRKSTDLSEARTVISDDFTDAEDIEDYETAPLEDTPTGKDGRLTPVPDTSFSSAKMSLENEKTDSENKSPVPSVSKPLMEVHPMATITADPSKYNTFTRKAASSPQPSPKQKRKDDPDRYRTHTITPPAINRNKGFPKDANGNPDLKFATFRVGPKVLKPNLNSDNEGGQSNSASPNSSPGGSPKGIRGRRKPLYSSLPPSAIIRKEKPEKEKINPPPIPPKPGRGTSPSGVYVRPTRTTELRIAANSRENSPRRENPKERQTPSKQNSRNSSSSSLNMSGIPVAGGRPKVAPKPPLRTTPSISKEKELDKDTKVPIQIKTSSSSFFPQGDSAAGMKGYSTLPKNSKIGGEGTPFSLARYGRDSKESINGSEKGSVKGKITNLWKKIDFRNNQPVPTPSSGNGLKPKEEKEKGKSSKLSQFFGRKKDKDKDKGREKEEQPFRPAPALLPHPARNSVVPADPAPASTSGGQRVRRDGELADQIQRQQMQNNKVFVAPFNYTPPDRSATPITTSSNAHDAHFEGKSSKITTV